MPTTQTDPAIIKLDNVRLGMKIVITITIPEDRLKKYLLKNNLLPTEFAHNVLADFELPTELHASRSYSQETCI